MTKLSRRTAIRNLSAASLGAFLLPRFEAAQKLMPPQLKQSACRWCYNSLSLEDLCKGAKMIGLQSIELTGPDDWPMLEKYGLKCAVGFHQPEGFGITKGFNRLENHETLVAWYEQLIPKAAAAKVPNVICFSGNREGLSDEQGLANCAIGLRKLLPTAQKFGVTIIMELLNSKIDHADYQCDHTDWGVALAKTIDSEHFKLLFDIYHMQIMDGDIIRNIREAAPYIGHYHTGGVPGRNEINDTQELNYPAIMRAIAETGYQGFIGQEFIPTRTDVLTSLEEGYKICNV